MKKVIFNVTTVVFGSLVTVNSFVGNSIIGAVAFTFNCIHVTLRSISRFLMNAVDSEKLNYMEAFNSQIDELSELKLLTLVAKTKEDALKNRMWTAQHTIALERIGSTLYSQYNWKPARVHGYLRQVVESIPGMTYMPGGDYGDE